jgi:predicted secreted protein
MEVKQSYSFGNSKWNSPLFYGFLPLLLLMAGLNSGMGADKDLSNERVITITQENNGKLIELKNGEVFRIELEELGSAGYQWHMEKMDQGYLEFVSKETKVLAEEKVGAPVMAIWLFKAKKTGQTEIALDHYRNWEGKDRASKHFSIRLLIK